MIKPTEASKLETLEKSLPNRIRMAAHEVSIAEQHLAQLLTLRAAGETVKGAEIAVARMALARTLRNVEDLGRVQSVLPAMLEQAHDTKPAASTRAARPARTGERVVLLAGD